MGAIFNFSNYIYMENLTTNKKWENFLENVKFEFLLPNDHCKKPF